MKLGKARAVIFLVAAKENIDIFEYSPNTVKKNLVGYGHATKAQIVKMIERIFPNLKIEDENSADALAVGYVSFNAKKSKIFLKVDKMIVKLKGFIEFCGDDYIDLDVNGVVFRVFISNKSIKKIYPSDSLISIFVYEIIKENERLFLVSHNMKKENIFRFTVCSRSRW